MTVHGVPDDEMPDTFPLGLRGTEPPGGQGLDAVLSVHLESLLAGQESAVPAELRPVGDILAALRAPASPAELSGEAAALARFRALAGDRQAGSSAPARDDVPVHTLVLDAAPAGRRRKPRTRHRRPVLPRAIAGPSLTRRLRVASAVVVGVVAVVGGFAFSGRMPGPLRGLAHDSSAAPPASRSATGSGPGTSQGGQGTHGRQSSARATPYPSVVPGTPRARCLAYAANPWWPAGPQSWDWRDFEELSAKAGGTNMVWAYCAQYLWDGSGNLKPGVRFPAGFPAVTWSQGTPSEPVPPGGPGYGSTGTGNPGHGGSVPGNGHGRGVGHGHGAALKAGGP